MPARKEKRRKLMNKELSILLPAMRAAGSAVLHLQKTGFGVERKANNDLVTEADLLVNDMIMTKLAENFPDDGCLSEESKDHPARLSKQRVWIIDPIDGTIEFANGVPEYAISIALVENSQPILAAIYNPATEEMFHAIKNHGAWLNDQPLACIKEPAQDFLLLASRSEYKRGEWSRYEKQHRIQQIGSIAYKMALVAAGRAHATFSLGPKNEWDVAAGTLLVTEAGGLVSDKYQQPLLFNQSQVLLNSVIATAASCHAQIFALIGSEEK